MMKNTHSLKPIPKEWKLSEQQLFEIFQVEKLQATIIRNCKNAEERRMLYGVSYEEYFKQLPFHPQLTIKKDKQLKTNRVNFQLRQILPFLTKNKILMEMGAGDCSLSVAASKHCNVVYALEVSAEVTSMDELPEKVKLVLFDGFNIPLSDNTVDIAYSNQLMEHLHPDDAEEQLRSIFRVLKKNGMYICITPNRISGPHDISRFFTDHAVGFHLKEYSAVELRQLFLSAGFSNVIAYVILKGRKIELPFCLVRMVEWMAEQLSQTMRERFLKFRPVSIIFHAIIAAVK